MECRMFEITLISARNLEDVRLFRRMRVYATVSIGGGPEERTPTSNKRQLTNPAWNFTMRFPIGEWMVENYNAMLVVKLYCERTLGDRYIGEVHAPMKDLLDVVGAGGGSAVMSFPMQKVGADSQGSLKFSYCFGEKLIIECKMF